MNQTIAMITLAVDDLSRALAFYRDGLGWTPAFETNEIVFFQMNGFVFSLFRKDEFEKEVGSDMTSDGKSIGLAHNVASKEDVDAVIGTIRTQPGGRIVREPIDRVWGGYSGYFEDPDGHIWEVAWNPHWTYSPEGFVTV